MKENSKLADLREQSDGVAAMDEHEDNIWDKAISDKVEPIKAIKSSFYCPPQSTENPDCDWIIACGKKHVFACLIPGQNQGPFFSYPVTPQQK